MRGGWQICRRKSEERRTAVRRFFSSRLLLEALEDRRLLTANSDLVVDPSYQASSLIVQFREGASYAGSLAAYSAGSPLDTEWAIAPGMREVPVNSGNDLNFALAAYKADPNVVFAEPDYRVKLNMIPNDPDFVPYQWDLHNTGQVGGVVGSDIRAPEAWEVTTGLPSVIVAVIDTGVDYTHPDLAPNMWTNPGEIPANGIDDDHNGYVDDIHGYDFVNHDGDPMDDYFHGTHVAGTIAAAANNEIGISGVAPNVQIMALKFLDDTGNGFTSDAIAALNYAVANGALISNNSWGGDSYSQAFASAIQNAATHGHLLVCAAGNDSNNNDVNPFYPASYGVGNILSVAATDAGDYLAWFSNYGHESVDLGAPGVDIYSTLPTALTPGMLEQGVPANYGMLNGSSMAAPHVAGVAALVWSMHPEYSPHDVMEQILSSVDPVESLTGKTVSGGRLNAAAALGVVPVDTTPPHVVDSDPSGVTTGPVDHVRFTFSEPIDATTFDANDMVSISGPNGSIGVIGVTPVPGSNRQFDMQFDPQETPGEYMVVIGPHIADLAGNELDENNDGVGGMDGDDNYTATFTINIAGVYSFPALPPNVPVSLWGFEAFASSLTIDDDLPIADVNVKLNLSFPRVGNLRIWLVSPTGITVNLSYRHGGDNPDFQDTVFDDQGDMPIARGEAPFTGSFQPDDPLDVFNRTNARGTWQLFVQNVSDMRNRGTLNAWSLEITKANTDVILPPENDPPIAVNDTVTAIQNTPLTIQPEKLLANDSDPNDDPLTIVLVATPVGGSVEKREDGVIVFTPELSSLAPGSFQYVVSDGKDSAVAKVTVLIQPQYALHNGYDVNNDGKVSPIDALLIINFINAFGPTPIDSIHSAATKYYYDVVPDNKIAANDALAVINFLNGNGVQTLQSDSGEGEGEPARMEPQALDADAVDQCLTADKAAAATEAGASLPGRWLELRWRR